MPPAPSIPTSQWPTDFAARSLDSKQWTYLAEGGKNLLLRYEGPSKEPFVHQSGRRVALRLAKVQRGGKTVHRGPAIDPLEWRKKVLMHDLGSAAILPPLIRLQDDEKGSIPTFLKHIAAKIETMRPLDRRKKTGIDESGKDGLYISEDLSASIDGKQILSVEIKPKCGFLPSPSTQLSQKHAQVKRRFSRYRMHRVLKAKVEPILKEFHEWYDPLDLYSGDSEQIRKASDALLEDWKRGEGNLRIFLNGERVEASHLKILDEMAEKVAYQKSFKDFLFGLLSSHDAKGTLSRLLKLQSSYDNLDVEGVAALYETATGQSLSEANEPEPTIEEYQSVIKKDVNQGDHRQAVVKLLLSAMYKDCSIFIRCISSEAPQFYLVDLDPKPIEKLPYFERIDRDVCKRFLDWAQENELL